jgi:starch phosphorylase
LLHHNPVELLRLVDPERLAGCARDPEFLEMYDVAIAAAARDASSSGAWFAQRYAGLERGPVAYFCAEFGLHNSVPIYSGGLGILAGDHCKAGSDLGVPIIAVGLLYTQGYFDQRLRLDGWQEDAAERFHPEMTPLQQVLSPTGDPCLVKMHAFGRSVCIGAWRMMVGRVPIYLLDTDIEQNEPADRALSHRLYTGSPDLRLRQEWILGAGGVQVLRALGNHPVAWHCNEGHPAFLLLERLRELTAAGTPYADAIPQVRATSIFTTHTPVPAGHDAFSLEQVEQCMGPIWNEMGVGRDVVLRLGHHPAADHNHFHMAALAIRLSGRVNGVSERHGQESRRIWASLWPGRDAAAVPIRHVTNGVHLRTWMSHRMWDLVTSHLGPDWEEHVDEPALWEHVLSLDDQRLWSVHLELKVMMLRGVREEARRRWADQWKEALQLVGAGTLLDERALTIGFARRFATYKRADLLFHDMDRLRRLLVDPWRPVQIIFAGKAHPADDPGKQMLQRVYHVTRDPRCEGRIAFVEDYEMHLAHRLVQGVDLWLNLPRAPLEACGTSGMKAAVNGVPQLSVLDGWWREGFDGENGWAIPEAPAGVDTDAADAERLYSILEEQVVPLYYTRDARGIPLGWTRKMKHALRTAGGRFTSRRMVEQYVAEYYAPAMRGDLPSDDPPTA